jgi:hypothetical protein
MILLGFLLISTLTCITNVLYLSLKYRRREYVNASEK